MDNKQDLHFGEFEITRSFPRKLSPISVLCLSFSDLEPKRSKILTLCHPASLPPARSLVGSLDCHPQFSSLARRALCNLSYSAFLLSSPLQEWGFFATVIFLTCRLTGGLCERSSLCDVAQIGTHLLICWQPSVKS